MKNLKIMDLVIQKIVQTMPTLDLKLKQADITDSPEYFVKKTLMSAGYMALGVGVFLFLVLAKLGSFTKYILMATPIIFIILFVYFLRVPDVKVLKKQKAINSEIVFAGRFLIIELESGVPLYDAFKNIAKNYPEIGTYFNEIIVKIDFGTQMEDALNETIGFTPNANFRKILWQIINSQKTGADMSKSIKSVVEQITQEQLIEVKEYGRKLNPLAMFYMIIAVILPSIGITMFIVLSSFLNLTLTLPLLLTISGLLGFMQFMFLAMIKSSRPAVEL